jgi:uncharacterized Zn-finger protein
MTVNNPLYYSRLADCAIHYISVKRGEKTDLLCPYCRAKTAKTAAPRREDEPARCVWTEDENGPWETGCGHTFEFFEDGPSENGAAFCLYCGKPVEEKLFDYASLVRVKEEGK